LIILRKKEKKEKTKPQFLNPFLLNGNQQIFTIKTIEEIKQKERGNDKQHH
jgi:hypothetical protein